jgi:lysophospholipase L1-like esterase
VLLSADHDYDGASTSRVENRSHFDLQFGGICAQCNSGWLRELDVAAKEVALELALQRRIHVRADEVLPLANSLYRASLVGMWGKREQHGLPAHRYPDFFQSRRPPQDVHILIGHNDAGFLFAGAHYSAVTVDGTNETAVRSFAFGGIGHLFVVALVGPPEIARTTTRLAQGILREAGGTLQRLWPNPRQRVNLSTREISRETALRVAELGAFLGLREPSPPMPIPDNIQQRFATEDDVRRRVRPATKQIPG